MHKQELKIKEISTIIESRTLHMTGLIRELLFLLKKPSNHFQRVWSNIEFVCETTNYKFRNKK